ncbi:MAG: hypothetical protein RL605_349 [Actinomycetota bacterium]
MPQRPLPPEIYRRRRFLALAVLAVVVWLLTVVVSGIANLAGGGKSNASPAPSTATSTAAVAGGACAPGTVTVTAHVGTAQAVDQNSFAAKVQPSMWLELANTGTVDCNFDFIGAATYLTITSGAETIWTNKDCASFTADAKDSTVPLAAGTSQRTSPITWARTRSSATTGCEASGNTPAAAGAYHLVATVSNIHSPDVQFLLN